MAAIADARHLWSEVGRLKAHVLRLQQSERQAHEAQQRLEDYVSSFVTHAQLEAALCTKISQSSVASSIDRMRGQLQDQLEKKADMDVVQALQSKKLDISVYESSTWDLKKFRTALEQSVHDLFSQFALQIEAQVNAKLSIEDFDRIFNPEANGQRAALDTAAARIARMNSQLESLQDYVQSDRQWQHKLADINVGLLDLTRKHNASRSSIAQLFTSFENTKERAHAVEEDNKRLRLGFDELMTSVGEFQTNLQAEAARQQQSAGEMRQEVDALVRSSQQTTQTLAQIQQFTQNTLLKTVDARLKQMNDTMEQALREGEDQQLKLKTYTAQQLSKTGERVTHTMERQSELETRMRRVETTTANVRDDLAEVKGPLMTAARNLREENVAILEEIRRSQDDSRDILIDYKGLLEKDTVSLGHPAAAVPPPSRPASSAAAINRKHRQQQIHALSARVLNNSATGMERPQTSHARIGGSPGSRVRARTASGISPRAAASTPPRPAHLPVGSAALRPRPEAGVRRKHSLLYAIGTSDDPHRGESWPPATDSGEYFTFPRPSTVDPQERDEREEIEGQS